MPGVVIVGAGHAGGRTALQLRSKGYQGAITLIGEETEFPYERPPLSKEFLLGNRTSESCRLAQPLQWNELDITLSLGNPATSLHTADKVVRTKNGQHAGYDNLVIATGGRCRKLDCTGSQLKHVFELRDIAHSRRIGDHLVPDARIVIAGGGFIGLEIAAAGISKGCKVTVVEVADRLLGRVVTEPISARVLDIHEHRGVKFVFSDSISHFEGRGSVNAVQLAGGETLPADLVVVGIGLVPETGLAAQASLEVDDGIVANAFCQASQPEVYAVGDCARAYNQFYDKHMRLESWQNAEQQAEIAASHICGVAMAWQSVPWFWTDQYQYNIQMAGNILYGDVQVVRGAAADDNQLFCSLQDGRITGAVAIGKGTSMAKDLRVAQMLIQKKTTVSPSQLENPGLRLKSLLRDR
jgi:3-phenylpropionate/trans-cinnamate dioxygenase ferredoxin reductase subunit